MSRRIVLVLCICLTSACSGVGLKPAGEEVAVGYNGNIQHCQFLGTVEAQTLSKVVVERNRTSVQDELYTLARNQAGSMGATNIIQRGLPEDGNQSFSAYDCPRISHPIS